MENWLNRTEMLIGKENVTKEEKIEYLKPMLKEK